MLPGGCVDTVLINTVAGVAVGGKVGVEGASVGRLSGHQGTFAGARGGMAQASRVSLVVLPTVQR